MLTWYQSTFAIILFGFILTYFLPYWWLVVPVAGLSLLFGKKYRSAMPAFLSGFIGVALLWLIWMLFFQYQNDGILAGRIAGVLNISSAWLLIVISCCISGFLGGLGGLCGYYARMFFR